MRLDKRYAEMTTAERLDLANRAAVSPGYLYQIATRWNGKTPSIHVIKRLAQCDKRLTERDMAAEFLEPANPPAATHPAPAEAEG